MYGANDGGAERALLRLASEWRQAGHEVIVVGEGERRPVNARSMSRGIAAEVQAGGADILFSPGQTYSPAFALAKLRLRLRAKAGAPPLVQKISNLPHHPGRPLLSRSARWWLRTQERWTDLFCAPDEAMAAHLAALGLTRAKLIITGNACASAARLRTLHEASMERRIGSSSERRPLRLLAAGRLVEQKNFALLINAFSNVATPEDELTILGDGPLREELRRRAEELPARVKLPGFTADPLSHFAAANAFALSSDFEGLPAVIVEALAAGLPVAATEAAPGLAELLGRGRFGELVPVRDRQALAAALGQLRTAQPDGAAMYRQALRFTAEEAAPVFLRAFEGVAKYRAKSE